MDKRRPDTDQMRPLTEAGYQLIPLHRFCETTSHSDKKRSLGKSPTDRRWTTKPYNNEDVLNQAQRFGRNVGVRLTAEDLVIDIDPRSIKGGLEAAEQKLSEFRIELSAYPTVATGSGGYHLYMRKSAGVVMRDCLSEQWRGIEFKTLGRQVVAPGSIHPNGTNYSWANTGFDLEELWLGAPTAPEAIVEAGAKKLRDSKKAKPCGESEHPPTEIKAILEHFDFEDFRDHDTWLSLMMSVHHASGGKAREEFVEWCETDPPYSSDGEEIRYRWDSLNGDGIGLGTLYWFMQQQGCNHLIDRRARFVRSHEFGEVV